MPGELTEADIAEFIARHRRQREAAGRPWYVEDEAVLDRVAGIVRDAAARTDARQAHDASSA